MERIGFIGLGVMGRPMALHLLRAGHPLTVFARRPDAARPLTEAGAALAATPREVAQASDVVFTMVTAGSDVESIALGEPERRAATAHAASNRASQVEAAAVMEACFAAQLEPFQAPREAAHQRLDGSYIVGLVKIAEIGGCQGLRAARAMPRGDTIVTARRALAGRGGADFLFAVGRADR